MHTLGRLAEVVGGSVQGDPARKILGITSLEEAQPEDLSFFTHPAYRQAAIDSSAGALVVARADDRLTSDLLISDDPALAVARILEIFHPSAPHDLMLSQQISCGNDRWPPHRQKRYEALPRSKGSSL